MIGRAAPFTPLASRDERNKMTLATSSGDGQSLGSAFGIFARLTGWSMVVGSTAFTVIPSPFTSAASDSVHRTSALFDIAYAALFREPLIAPIAETLTMRP